jgi:hypothetical protein
MSLGVEEFNQQSIRPLAFVEWVLTLSWGCVSTSYAITLNSTLFLTAAKVRLM